MNKFTYFIEDTVFNIITWIEFGIVFGFLAMVYVIFPIGIILFIVTCLHKFIFWILDFIEYL